MSEHGLDRKGWSFAPTYDRRRLGVCDYSNKVVGVSLLLADEVSEEVLTEVIIHEVAHVIAGRKAGHGPVWREVMESLGGDPRAKITIEGIIESDPWRGVCKKGHEVSMAASPRRIRSCALCSKSFSLENLMKWFKNGVEVTPEEIGGRYFKEYRQLLVMEKP